MAAGEEHRQNPHDRTLADREFDKSDAIEACTKKHEKWFLKKMIKKWHVLCYMPPAVAQHRTGRRHIWNPGVHTDNTQQCFDEINSSASYTILHYFGTPIGVGRRERGAGRSYLHAGQ